MNNEEIYEVTVLLICYNHEQYIEQALESILMQRVNFKIEVIVADDCSTDNTVSLIEKFSVKYPGVIKFLPKQPNLGVTNNYKRAFKAARGKYIAVLEGDDYWTSPYKLQIQRDFLEEHLECSFCAHKFTLFQENKKKFVLDVHPSFTQSLYTTKDLILSNFIGNFSTCMYRQSIMKLIPDTLFNLSYVVDWMFNICYSLHGVIGYQNQPLSIYRQHAAGEWSKKTQSEKIKSTLDLIDEYNAYLEFNFNEEFNSLKTNLNLQLQACSEKNKSKFKSLKRIMRQTTPKIIFTLYDLMMPPFLKKS